MATARSVSPAAAELVPPSNGNYHHRRSYEPEDDDDADPYNAVDRSSHSPSTASVELVTRGRSSRSLSMSTTASKGSFRSKMPSWVTNMGRRTLGIMLLLVVVFLWTVSNFLASVSGCANPLSVPLFSCFLWRYPRWHPIVGIRFAGYVRRWLIQQAVLPSLRQHFHVRLCPNTDGNPTRYAVRVAGIEARTGAGLVRNTAGQVIPKGGDGRRRRRNGGGEPFGRRHRQPRNQWKVRAAQPGRDLLAQSRIQHALVRGQLLCVGMSRVHQRGQCHHLDIDKQYLDADLLRAGRCGRVFDAQAFGSAGVAGRRGAHLVAGHERRKWRDAGRLPGEVEDGDCHWRRHGLFQCHCVWRLRDGYEEEGRRWGSNEHDAVLWNRGSAQPNISVAIVHYLACHRDRDCKLSLPFVLRRLDQLLVHLLTCGCCSLNYRLTGQLGRLSGSTPSLPSSAISSGHTPCSLPHH